jgi:2-hydroxy-3-oxopropionate reductase
MRGTAVRRTGLRPVRRTGVRQQVFEQLRDGIVRGTWPAGSRLPSESTLTQKLGSSRIAVREAIQMLAMGSSAVLCGPVGSGNVTKLANQIIVALNIAAMSEALVLAGNFAPGFRIELHIKDLQNALDTAHEVGVPIPLTSQVMEIMQALKVDGKAGEDHSGIVQFYEKLAGVKARR